MQMFYLIKNVVLCCSHLFAIANISYTTMMDAKKDQCIVIRYDIQRHLNKTLKYCLLNREMLFVECLKVQ